MKTGIIPGFVYDCEIIGKDGRVIESFRQENIIPLQGIGFIASLLLGSGAVPTDSWYVGLLNSGFSVNENSTLQGAAAAENTDYTATSNHRKDWDYVYDNEYEITNIASRAEFEFEDETTIYGAFLSNVINRAAHSGGVLLSVASFSSPKTIEAGATLRVKCGITLSTT